jgi:hypothetical protein
MKGFLLAPFLLLSLFCFSQDQAKAFKPVTVQVFMGYVIRVDSSDKGGYCYAILQQGEPVISQKLNPFTLSLKGFLKQEDAFKIARWQVQQLAGGAPSAMISDRAFPPSLAKQLNIGL